MTRATEARPAASRPVGRPRPSETSRLSRLRSSESAYTVTVDPMGAAVAITAFASDRPPLADRLILSGPGLRGWGALNPVFASTLWLGAKVAPGLVVRPPAFAKPKLTITTK